VVVQAQASGGGFPIRYDIQPLKNISLTRNRSVALAAGRWLAFIDDDERASADWLEKLAEAATVHCAEGVLAPVEPIVPETAAPWLRRGKFYSWKRMKTGTVVPIRFLRFGNVLLRADLLRRLEPAFDPAYGLTGGEDGDLLARLVQDGARIVWCDEAEVVEPVAASRLSLRWLLLRSLRGGQGFARHVMAGRHGPPTHALRARLLLRAWAQFLLAGVLSLLCLPFGRHLSALWLTRAAANLGKLSAFLGLRYQEYA